MCAIDLCIVYPFKISKMLDLCDAWTIFDDLTNGKSTCRGFEWWLLRQFKFLSDMPKLLQVYNTGDERLTSQLPLYSSTLHYVAMSWSQMVVTVLRKKKMSIQPRHLVSQETRHPLILVSPCKNYPSITIQYFLRMSGQRWVSY